ncbi:PLxRFG domain-containing protein [Stenotrophomonas acidaminiphila]|uniref:PLxRFG domain-containing protein n=1 Tax=Stenotrophomonas acidaminiphila TaxID=128780 RepID=UPI0028AB3F3B|nr:PLxRFG domain-containing protein [Stenotrophomonas acidaminiphila]
MSEPWKNFGSSPGATPATGSEAGNGAGPWSRFAAKPSPAAPAGERIAKRPERSWGQALGDTALGVAAGAANLVGGLVETREATKPANLARQGLRLLDRAGVPGAGSLAAKMPGTLTERQFGMAPGAGSAATSKGVQMVSDAIGGAQSEALQQEKQELAETKGFIGSAKKVLTSPRLLGNFVAEQVPNIATMGMGTRVAAARAGERALAGALTKGLGMEAAETAAAAAGKKAATTAATGMTTVMEAGQAGQQTYQQAMAQPQSVWDANLEYRRMVAAGADPVTAKETIARGASLQAQVITAPIAAVAGRFAAPFEADVFTGRLARRPMAMLQGAARETVEETIQEGGSQFAGNVAQRQIDPNQGVWEGVPEAAGTGAALGAVLGGGLATGGALASERRGAAAEPGQDQPAQPPELPPEQLALPPSDGTPAYGVNVVTPGGTVLTPEQRGLDPRVTGEPAAPAPNPASVPGVRVADDSLNQQAPRAAAPAVPFPDAAPGSIADVANVTAAARRSAPEPAAAEQVPAQSPPAAPTIPPPWVDAETGEALRAPTTADIEQLLHANLDYQMQNGGGISSEVALNTMRDQYGLGRAVVGPVLSKVKAERKRGIAAPQAPAEQPQGSLLPAAAASEPSADERLLDQVRQNAAARRASIEALASRRAPPTPSAMEMGDQPVGAAAHRDALDAAPAANAGATPGVQAAEAPAGATPVVPATRESSDRSVEVLDGAAVPPDSPAVPAGGGVKAAADTAATSPTNDLPEPTDAQKEAGNYPKGHVRLNGHDISIENPAGSKRRPEWPALKNHYGYIKGTVGKDKDHVDVFMTDRAEDTSLPVFVIDQVNKDGSFDEHKVVLGTADEAEARKTYLANYEKGWTGLGGIKEMTQDEFKAWVRDPKKTTRRVTRAPRAAPPATAQSPAAEGAQPSPRTAPDARAVPADARPAAPQYTPRVRRIGGSPEYDRSDVGTLGAYFQPGRIVKAYGNGLDRVLAFEPADPDGRWRVQVQAVDASGNPMPEERPRWHSTLPSPRELAAVLGKPQLKSRKAAAPRKATKEAAPAATAKSDPPRLVEEAPNGIKIGDRVSVNMDRNAGTPRSTAPYEATVVAIEANAAPAYQGTAFKVAQDDAKPDGRGTGWVGINRVTLVAPAPANVASAEPPAGRQGKGGPARTEPPPSAALFSLPPDPVGSPEFRRWFADSQVIGRGGKPEVVFHGTAEDFWTFSKHRSGQATGHATAPLGHFFTTDRALAQRYAENASDGVPADERVVDAYLRIQNPYEMSLEEAQSLDSPDASEAFRRYLQRQGHDGIHIAEAKTWIAFQPEQIKSASENWGAFDLTNPDIRFSRSGDGAAGGMDFDRALQLKAELTAKWGDNAPSVVVVRSAEDFPASAKVDPSYRRAEGFFNGSPTVWINAGAISSEARFGQVLAHEALGHFGVESVVGAEDWAQIVGAIDKLASEGGGSAALQSVLEDVSRRYGTVDRETFAKEAIAVMAERGIRNSFTSRMVAAVRRFLRRVMPSLQWSEADIRDLLSQADSFLRSGRPAAERQAAVRAYAFSRANAPASLQPDPAEAAAYREAFDKIVPSLRTVVPPIRLGRTPAVLRALGAPDLPITITRDVVRKASNGIKHNVSLEALRRMPEELADPLAVFNSKTEPGSLVVVTELTDQAGKPVIVALRMRQVEARLEVNRVASAYGKDGAQPFAGWSGELAYESERAARSPLLESIIGARSPSENEKPRPGTTGPALHARSGSPSQGSPAPKVLAERDVVQQAGEGPVDPDRRLFSLPSADALADIDTIQKGLQGEGVLARARQMLADMVPRKLKDQWRPTWLGALATRHLTELGGDYFKNIDHYSHFLAEMQADRNQLQAEAEAIAEPARKWASKNKAEAERLFDLMHDATIDGVDPSKAYQPLMFKMPGQKGEFEVTKANIDHAIKVKQQQMKERSGDSKANMINEIKALTAMGMAEPRRRRQYAPLVERWNQLSPEAQAIYTQFRDAYRQRSDAVEEALAQRIEDLAADGVSDQQRKKMVTMLRQQFESARMQGVYFPLQRFGSFFVAAEKDDTNTFMMFKTVNELDRAVDSLRAKGWTVTASGKKGDKVSAKDAPSGTFVADVIQQLRDSHVSDKVQDEIYQLYLEAMPELSMRKHSIHRKSVPGFDPDAVRAFAYNMHHGSHQLARLRYSHKLQEVLNLLTKQQDAARKEPDANVRRITAGDTILEELKRRHDWIMNPTDSALTNLVSSFGFTYYLGATPAAALVNLTQTALVSYPFLAARHGGVKSMNYLLAASRDAVRTMGNIQRTLTDPEEQRAYQALQAAGAIEKTQAHNLAGIAEGGMAGYNPAWAKAMEIIGWGFHKTEVVNREATGMAAFRLARDGGAAFDEAVKFARDAIFDTHFDYSNANRARYMQSGTAKVLLMFRQYSLNMSWALGRMVWQATKGQDPEVRKIARRNLAGVLGMSTLFSGALGLPMMGVVMGVLNAVQATFGDDDEPWDAETEFRAFLGDMLGPSAAEVLLRGPANKLTGANIAGRVGLDSLWIRDADRELDGRGMFNNLLEQAAGPMGGVLKNVLVGKQQIDEGHLLRGVETMLPKGMKDVLKAARYATQGVNTLRGDPVVEDVSLWQALLQGAGFAPAEVAERYERNRALKNYEEHITRRRETLMNAFALAVRNGDQPTREAVMEKIRAFNRANPEVAISASSIRASMKSRAGYSAKAEGGIVLNPKLSARLQAAVGPE